MTQDPRTTARAAREGLAQGLSLLQSPGLPPAFLDAAEPIARAMGALMQAERSDGTVAVVKPHAETALGALREALGRLQSIQTGHPAAEQAMATVAGSLGHVHGLTRLEPPPQATQYQAPAPQYQAPAPQYQAPPAAPQFQPPAPAPQYQAPQYQAPQYQPPPAAPQFAPPQPAFAQPAAPQYQAPPAAPAFQPPAPQQAAWQPPAAPHVPQAPAVPGFGAGHTHSPSQNPPAPGAAGESLRPPAGAIEAELGAHSPSNFYKTLSGNDIVEHGGIFVATYNVPRIGAQVLLRVHLPGGYHFDANASVRWTREERGNPDAPPGFGAQFHGITAEQRQLIMRYARNREPLFYDDL